jgi:hypothetical protein
MNHIRDLTAVSTRPLRLAVLAVVSAALAGTATMTLIAGTADPSGWVATYEHSRPCAAGGSKTTVVTPAAKVAPTPRSR